MSSRFLLIAALLAISQLASASIEPQEPVKVTYKNSGPSYQIDDIERVKVPDAQAESGSASENPTTLNREREDNNNNNEQGNIGHVSIRRIFLVPMMPGPMHPPDNLWQSNSNQKDLTTTDERRKPSDYALRGRYHPLLGGPLDPDNNNAVRPTMPFMPISLRHLFGQDQASRPSSTYSPEKSTADDKDITDEQARERFQSAVIDPIQLMMEMMHQAMHAHHREHDLNKEASGAEPGSKATDSTSLEKPKPMSETKEEIIEIEGKKYRKKTVVSKHVGENMIFMTKRLIFEPLDETDPSTTQTPTTTTLAPSSTEQEVKASTTEQSTTPLIELVSSTTQAPAQASSSEEPAQAKPKEEQTTPKASEPARPEAAPASESAPAEPEAKQPKEAQEEPTTPLPASTTTEAQ